MAKAKPLDDIFAMAPMMAMKEAMTIEIAETYKVVKIPCVIMNQILLLIKTKLRSKL